ncbi:patatin-like phospholipase family protein [Shewanella submarina]|uniref:Patatin-like phospholipase family protein n=1 Tax=Shewanella submarina TaxID=2016376 RepID=A0ABV7G686_9GAMM|nr:patatin-like phospholipase family protein [Shewanella submarina]MCL1039327.1 patatin-like phospholipase family protein [Shewanella submarina]
MTLTLKVASYPMAAYSQPNDFPEASLTGFNNGDECNIGVTFSGGGTRSACCTLGQLKALHESGVLERVRYISAVSGGSWASVPFLFISNEQLVHYFAGIEQPNHLDEATAKHIVPGSFQSCLTNAGVLSRLLAAALSGKGDESYADVIGRIFLKPFDLHQPHKSFTYDQNTRDDALTRNLEQSQSGRLKATDFQLQRSNTPYLIVGATLLNHDGLNFKQKYPVEYTPLYSGIRTKWTDDDWFTPDDHFGGGYIESLGYDCKGPYREDRSTAVHTMTVRRSPKQFGDWTNEKAFSLSDIMASSGAAPQEITDTLGLRSLGFPEFFHIPIQTKNNAPKVADEYAHSDGGHMENLGIMPLLARGVSRIYVFINTKCAYFPQDNWQPDSSASAVNIEKTNINKSVKALFVPLRDWFGLKKFEDNLVFKDGRNKLKELIQAFNQQITVANDGLSSYAEEGLFYTQELETRKNKVFGVSGGQKVTVTWVYNQRSKAWEDSLASQELADEIRHQKLDEWDPFQLDNFPHYETFMENAAVINLKGVQTNLLASHAWFVARKALS